VPDMHCGACISRIEKALVALEGVDDVRVNLTNKSVSVCWSDATDPRNFVQRLVELGFHPVLPTKQRQQRDTQLADYIRALAVSGFAAGNVMLLSVSVWSGADQTTRIGFHWLSALITIPAVVYAGRFFFRSAWYALRSGKSNMDVPISVGIALACALSMYDTINHADRVYFESAIMLVFFLLIGRTFDYLVREKASNVVDCLHALEPSGAHRLGKKNKNEFVSVDALIPGDEIVVNAGERIPADGIVISGTSDIDSELVDGESVPKTVYSNQAVLSGTLNISAALIIRVTATAADSFLAKIKQLVRYGEGSKGPYRRLADRVSDIYTPFVHSAALLAFVGWYLSSGDIHRSLSVAISVLIITCPCALALAVPMVQAIAAQRLFASGIIMKNGAALEKARSIDAIVFDKTGTLTEGLPEVTKATNVSDDMLALAQQLAAISEHPYALAISSMPLTRLESSAPHTVPTLKSVQDIPGCGVEALLGEQQIRLGKRQWALGSDRLGTTSDKAASETIMSIEGVLVAEFQFEHRLRTDAVPAVEKLKTQVTELRIVSGDSAAPVQSIATQLELPANADCLPKDKLEKIMCYTKQGLKVLMVGDGLNDAGAMAAATVSIAPARAAGISRSVADFVFLRSSLMAIPDVISIARKANDLIRQNIMIALVYNLIALPVAFAGLVTPLLAAVAMSASSVLVVANAMRVRESRGSGNNSQSKQRVSLAT